MCDLDPCFFSVKKAYAKTHFLTHNTLHTVRRLLAGRGKNRTEKEVQICYPLLDKDSPFCFGFFAALPASLVSIKKNS